MVSSSSENDTTTIPSPSLDFGFASSWLQSVFAASDDQNRGEEDFSNEAKQRNRKVDDVENSSNNNNNNDKKDVDKILANALTGLSLEEREKAYEEIHGCDEIQYETSELLLSSLSAMDEELSKIKYKPAYDQAYQINRCYVEDMSLRLQFLRAEYFAPRPAARRMVKFMEQKLTLFPKALARPLYLSDLNKDDMATLTSGYIQFLPARDRSGRPIFMDLQGNHYHSYKTVVNMVRCFAYMMLAVAEDIDSQRRGVICCAWYLKNTGKMDPIMSFKLSYSLSWLPIRFTCVHFCTANALARAALPVLMQTSDDRKARFRMHSGTQTEVEYTLMSFGIPVQVLPVSSSGDIKKKEHLQWITRRKVKDDYIRKQQHQQQQQQQLSSASGGVMTTMNTFAAIDLPRVYDVLVGRGKKFYNHPGNGRLRQLAYQYAHAHSLAKPGQKNALVDNVIDVITNEGGRFLQHADESGWWTPASRHEARKKVSHTFRTARSTETMERLASKSKYAAKQEGQKRICLACFPSVA